MADKPRWLRAVLWAEGKVAEPLNRITNSQQGAEIMLRFDDGRRVTGGVAGRVRTGVVHALSLPSRRDVDLLGAQVQRLQRTLDDRAAEPGAELAESPGKPPAGLGDEPDS